MKTTGIIRQIDDLGRIHIPKEFRRQLKIKDGDEMEFFINGEDIIIRKHTKISKDT